MRDIVLSVKRSSFRSDDAFSVDHDKEFQKVRNKILARDKNSCQFCGFFSDKFQEVHHIDDDHSNNSLDNLITTCSLCHMCHHISFAGLKDMGTLIYLDPKEGITQAEINSLCRTLWMMEESKNEQVKSVAIEVYFRLYYRSTQIKARLGDSNPMTLGEYLMSLSDDDYNNRREMLSGIYLLPSRDGFKKQFRHWLKSYKGVSPRDIKKVSARKTIQWYNIKQSDGEKADEAALLHMLKEYGKD